jgi:hypothetical protein
MLSRLRCGVAPHEGLRYLSVGLEQQIELIERCLENVTGGQSILLVVERSYGEGKSHMLRLIGELAQDWSCATVYLAHSHLSEASFHRPSMLFRHILQGLEWNHPTMDLTRFHWEMNASYSYHRDRLMRQELADRLSGLARHCSSKGYSGLVVMLDELENYFLLHGRSRRIAVEVFKHLCDDIQTKDRCCVVLAATPQVTQVLTQHLNTQSLSPPMLTEDMAVALFDRLVRLHAGAFDWTPTLNGRVNARQLYRHIAAAAPASLWRAFVQRVVNLLDIEHQQTQQATVSPVPIVPKPVAMPPKREVSPIVPPSPPTPPKSKIAVGDTVVIMAGAMRGCVCKVTEIRGDKVQLIFGRNAIPVQVGIHQVKRQR